MPFKTFQEALEYAQQKANAEQVTWYVNGLTSSGPMQYAASRLGVSVGFGGRMIKAVAPEAYTTPLEQVETNVFYFVEATPIDANDWARVESRDYDSSQAAIDMARRYAEQIPDRYEYRVVQRTVTDETWTKLRTN